MRYLVLLLLQQTMPVSRIDVEKALTLPLSPGAVALLVENPSEPGALARLRESLAHSNPDVRAAAARVLYISGTRELLAESEAALAKETDSDPAQELMWLVAAQGGPNKAELVTKAAARLNLTPHAANVLAVTQQHLALRELDALRAAGSRSFPLTSFLSMAARFDFNALGAHTSKALREHDTEYWTAYLQAARELGNPADPGPLAFGISASDEVMRFQTLWHLVLVLSSGTKLPPLIEETLAMAISARDGLDGDGDAFLFELLSRLRGSKAQDSVESLVALNALDGGLLRTLSGDNTLVLLTENERRTLSTMVHGDENALDDRAEVLPENTRSPPRVGSRSRSEPMLTTVGRFPYGLVSDLIDVTRCDTKRNAGLTVADVRYSLDGRRLDVAFHVGPSGSDGCASMGRALALLDLHHHDPRSTEAGWDRVLVLHTPEYLECLQTPLPDAKTVRVGTGGRAVEPPKKTKDMAPTYPESARNDRVQGVVLLEGIITSAGCPQELRTLRSVDERLTLAAVYAVSQWKYEPVILDGVAVPIVMTITINFALTY